MAGDASRFNGQKGGRPIGSKSEKTLEKDRVLAKVKDKILQRAERIIDAQSSLALGQQYLYVIKTETINGKRVKSKPELVTDPETISQFLDGEYGDGDSLNDEEEYYFISTKEPSNQAIDSMMNRAFGRPTESLDVTSAGLPLILPSVALERHDRDSHQITRTDS